jgi:hypothetical protein
MRTITKRDLRALAWATGLARALAACSGESPGANADGGTSAPTAADGGAVDGGLGDGAATGTFADAANDATASVADADASTPLASDIGPSAAFFGAHPNYTCLTTRYVATAPNGGDDANDGTAPSLGGGHGPWLTLQHANDALPNPAAGYCVEIGDGTYSVTDDLHFDHGGALASTTGFTVWRAAHLLGAKLVAAGSTWTIAHVGAPYLIFDGLELDGGHRPSDGAGIASCDNGTAYNGVHHVFVLDSYLHDMGGNGIGNCWGEYYWHLHNRVDDNAYNSWNSGISTYEPIEIPGYTPTPYDLQWAPYHNVYAFNRAHANFTSPAGSPHTDGNGIEYDDTQHTQNDPKVVYAPKALFLGNLAWENGGFGIHIGPNSSNADVFNNTSYGNGRDPLNDGTWRGEISSALGSGNTYRNNIAFAVVGAGVLSHNTPFLGGNPLDATNSWIANIAFGSAPTFVAPDTFSTTENRVDTDPRFVDFGASNFALRPDSPALGFGVVVPYWPQKTAGSVDVGACPRGVTTCP